MQVPRWFQTLCGVLAVTFSVWTGLHYNVPHAATWLIIYGAVAVVTAILPAHRLVGVAGLVVAIAVAAWGAYLMRGAWGKLSFGDLGLAGAAGAAARDVAALGIGTVWLLAGSGFRILRA